LQDSTAFLVGLCRERGIVHLHSQHGFQYMNKCNFNWIPLTCADKYLSSGWTSNEDNKIIPAGLSKEYSKSNFKRNNKILYVSGSAWLYPLMLYDILSSEGWITYRKKQIGFLSSLPEYIRKKIVYRHQDSEWKDKIPLNDIQQEAMATGEPLIKSMQRYRITIIDHISTAWSESISLNNPCLIIADNELFPSEEDYKDVFNPLQKVGIVHTSFESARKKLLEVYSNCEKWWFSGDVQNVLKLFVENNLKSSVHFVNTLLTINDLPPITKSKAH
jgi:putative transferase (TIGR04331 family)